MVYLLDSNILLRWANKSDPERPVALAALRKLGRQGEVLLTTPQDYIEFWSSATRPVSVNGLGLTPAFAERLVNHLRAIFPLIPDSEAVLRSRYNLLSLLAYRVGRFTMHALWP